MRQSLRQLTAFMAKFLAIFLVFSAASPLYAPIYNTLTVGAANLIFPVVEEPDISLLRAEGQSIAIYVRDPERGPLLFGYLDYPHRGFVILLALLLATPALSWRRRFITAMLGVGLLFAIDAVYLVAQTRSQYVNALGSELPIPDDVWVRYAWLTRFLVVTSFIAPWITWALLTWRSWLPVPQPTRRPTKEARP
jgi:hypothetical protein